MSYSYEHNPTNPDATPLYNSSIFAIWNWFADSWSCGDWVTWHKAVSAKYGREEANKRFMDHWHNLALVTTTADCKTWNTAFRDYTRSVGLYGGISNVVSDVIGTVPDVAAGVGGGISSASKVVKILLPLIIIVIAVFGIVYLSKYAKKK